MNGPRFMESKVKQMMNRVETDKMPFQWSMNPYRGCTHGCSFCYARKTHTFLGFGADDTFQNHIVLKTNAVEALKAQLDKMAKRHRYDRKALASDIGLLAIGTATDPYQPIEARQQLTRACLEVLAEYRVPVTITTRSPLILRDVDVLAEMDIRSINMSLHTLDKRVWRCFEPATPSPVKRLEAVRSLRNHGFHAGIFLAPILPYISDSQEVIRDVVAATKEYGGQFVMPSVLRLTPEVKTWFMGVVSQHYPHLQSRLNALFSGTYAPKSYVQPLMQQVHQVLSEYCLPTQPSYQRAPRVWPEAQPYAMFPQNVSIQTVLPL